MLGYAQMDINRQQVGLMLHASAKMSMILYIMLNV